MERWKADSYGLSPERAHAGQSLGYLPASTSRPLDRHNPLLAMTVRKWMKNRGKTVKPKLTEEQTANLMMCFKMMDADGSGAIDAEELNAAFKLLGLNVTKKEVEAMLDEVDRDGSGEVEYAEFLEIMTVQLNKMAEERDSSSPSSSTASPAHTEGGELPTEGTGTPDAAALPFDIVATAYRRKKLLEALDLDDKDFLRSVAEEEEKRRSTEAVQQQQQEQQLPGGRAGPGRSSPLGEGRHRSLASPSAFGPIIPQTNAEFLQTLGRGEKKILDALARKYRECQDAAKAEQARQRRLGGSLQKKLAAATAHAWVAQPNAIEAHRPGAVSPTPPQQQAPNSGLAWSEQPALARATTPSGQDVDSPPGWLPPSMHSQPTGTAGAMRAPCRLPYQPPGSSSACVPRSADAAALGGSRGHVLDSSHASVLGSTDTAALDSSDMPETDAEGADAQRSKAAAVGISRAHRQDWEPDAHQPDGSLEQSPATSHLSSSSGGDRLHSSLIGYRRATAGVDHSPPGERTGTLVQCRPSIFYHPGNAE